MAVMSSALCISSAPQCVCAVPYHWNTLNGTAVSPHGEDEECSVDLGENGCFYSKITCILSSAFLTKR